MMQKPEALLKILSTNTVRNDGKWKHKDLYRQLYNPALYQFAYQRRHIWGSTFKRNDHKSLSQLISQLVTELRSERYQPQPLSKTEQPTNRKNFNPLFPADQFIQEIIKSILEAIYEPIFTEDNHGFRPGKSCHTALLHMLRNAKGIVWWITGELKETLQLLSHDKLMQLLQKKIGDERFLRLIRKFLNAGYLEEWYFSSSLSGRPQGGILSPILVNIYLHELDQWIYSQSIQHQLCYTRYLDAWVIGIKGKKKEAIQLQQNFNRFLSTSLEIQTDDQSKLIHGEKGVPFLGYHLAYAKPQPNYSTDQQMYQLWMPKRKEYEFILENGLGKQENGQWKALAVKKLFTRDDQTIINWYNAALRRIYDHYKLATNVSRLRSARWIWKLSWGKTMANKYRTQKAKIFAKYRVGKRIGIKQNGKQGEQIIYLFDEPLNKHTDA